MMDHWGYEKVLPYWINESGRDKGTVFICSSCKGRCYCINYGANKNYNRCNYRYCPRCGSEMNTEKQARYTLQEVDAN